VPTLIDGDVKIFDSTVILEYIEDRWAGSSALAGLAGGSRAVRMLEDQCDTYVEAINWGLAEIRVFGRATGELAERITARAGEQLAGVHRWLERELGARSWFNGESFGWGDLVVWPYAAAAAGDRFRGAAGLALDGAGSSARAPREHARSAPRPWRPCWRCSRTSAPSSSRAPSSASTAIIASSG
jgi:glutathione S-transferase/RNA polymerase-associated protein